jgi:ABC-type dipeptide/oligopeptide/nickel transport system ATPase component
MAALNPVMKVGAHIAEALLGSRPGDARRCARAAPFELLRAVKIVDPESASTITRISCRAACGSA